MHNTFLARAALTGMALAGLASLPAGGQSSANWPQFRGPDASGVAARPSAPPASWSTDPARGIGWTAAIPGLGHSSPIVWGSRVYVTTAVAAEGSASVVTGDVRRSGVDPATDTGVHAWHLIALDAGTGRVAWDTVAHTGAPRVKRHVKASHASATPATNGRVIVALMGSEGLFAFDMNGDPPLAGGPRRDGRRAGG